MNFKYINQAQKEWNIKDKIKERIDKLKEEQKNCQKEIDYLEDGLFHFNKIASLNVGNGEEPKNKINYWEKPNE